MGGSGLDDASRRGRVSRRARWAATALAAGSLLLASCAGGGSEEMPTASEPSSTPTSSPSATPTEPAVTTSPEPPRRPRSGNTPKGRKQFTTFVVERWGHALATNDAEVVTSLGPRGSTCQGCRQLRAELRKRSRQGWFVDFPGAEVKRVTVRPGDTRGVWVGTARISVPESRSYFEDGSYRNDNDAHPKVDFTVRMRHQAGRFVLLAFTVD